MRLYYDLNLRSFLNQWFHEKVQSNNIQVYKTNYQTKETTSITLMLNKERRITETRPRFEPMNSSKMIGYKAFQKQKYHLHYPHSQPEFEPGNFCKQKKPPRFEPSPPFQGNQMQQSSSQLFTKRKQTFQKQSTSCENGPC